MYQEQIPLLPPTPATLPGATPEPLIYPPSPGEAVEALFNAMKVAKALNLSARMEGYTLKGVHLAPRTDHVWLIMDYEEVSFSIYSVIHAGVDDVDYCIKYAEQLSEAYDRTGRWDTEIVPVIVAEEVDEDAETYAKTLEIPVFRV